MPPDPSLVRTLLTDDRWLTRIARQLVGADHADDAAQEARRIALEHGPRGSDPHGTRSWLKVVVKRVASRARRTDARRRRLELRRADPTLAESTLDVVERTGIHQAVVDAVMSMREPYRTTVLLRFYDDLSAVEIGERMGVSAANVRKRLSRGYAMLREQLSAQWPESSEPWRRSLAHWIACADQRLAITRERRWWFAGVAGAVGLVMLGLWASRLWDARSSSEPNRNKQAYVNQPGPGTPTRGLVINGRGSKRTNAQFLVRGSSADEQVAATSQALLRVPAAADIATLRSADTRERVHQLTMGHRDERQSSLFLVDAAASASGRVLDDSGKPIAGARVTLHVPFDMLTTVLGAAWRPFDSRLATTRTDHDGQFLLSDFPAVTAPVLEVLAPGRKSYRATTDLSPGLEVRLLPLPPPTR